MTTFKRTIQQASWRTRRQRLGATLLVIVGIVMLAWLYLDVATRTMMVGSEIQRLEYQTSSVKGENANLKTELARLLSYHEVNARSDALGFRRASALETHYLVIPGYAGKEPVSLIVEEDMREPNDMLQKEYTQSLFDWFGEQISGGSQR